MGDCFSADFGPCSTDSSGGFILQKITRVVKCLRGSFHTTILIVRLSEDWFWTMSRDSVQILLLFLLQHLEPILVPPPPSALKISFSLWRFWKADSHLLEQVQRPVCFCLCHEFICRQKTSYYIELRTSKLCRASPLWTSCSSIPNQTATDTEFHASL